MACGVNSHGNRVILARKDLGVVDIHPICRTGCELQGQITGLIHERNNLNISHSANISVRISGVSSGFDSPTQEKRGFCLPIQTSDLHIHGLVTVPACGIGGTTRGGAAAAAGSCSCVTRSRDGCEIPLIPTHVRVLERDGCRCGVHVAALQAVPNAQARDGLRHGVVQPHVQIPRQKIAGGTGTVVRMEAETSLLRSHLE
mmetsp:Transcript_65723/g.109557  ORF Transcript_65723/g.109557 Transcript_65723/m.109557 type:complete len:201 (+) Transcript_65723:1715-2317(+)